jgi:hypothetical protein
MKQILLIICIFLLPMACSEDEKAVLELSVNPSVLEFDNTESQKIHIVSNTSWSLSSNQTWCILSMQDNIGNETVDVMVRENIGDERIAYISLSNAEKTIIRTVKVIQKSQE